MKYWADCQLQNMIFRSKEWHEDGCSASLHLKLTISLFDLSVSEVQPFNFISLPALPPCQAKKSQMAVRKSKYSDWICRKGSILQNDLSDVRLHSLCCCQSVVPSVGTRTLVSHRVGVTKGTPEVPNFTPTEEQDRLWQVLKCLAPVLSPAFSSCLLPRRLLFRCLLEI